MEISFHAITANRWLPKAKVRHAEIISSLERTATFVSTDNLPFDILQVLLLDRDDSYAHAVGQKSDRIFQFEVAAPDSTRVDYRDVKAFVGCLADRLKVAVNGCGLPKETAAEVTQNIEEFKRNI